MVLNQSQLLRILSRLSTLMFHVEHYVVWLTLKSRARRRNWGSPNLVSRSELWVPQGKAWVSLMFLMFHVEHCASQQRERKVEKRSTWNISSNVLWEVNSARK